MWQYYTTDFLMHYGKGHLDGGKSGRYPWGSGKKNKSRKELEKEAAGMSDADLNADNKRRAAEKQYVKNHYVEDTDPVGSQIKFAKDATDTAKNGLRSIKQIVDDDIRSTPKTVDVDLSKMTDQELRERINRAALEQQYINYYGSKKVQKGKVIVSDILEAAGGVLGAGASALAIALAVHQLKQGD